MAAGVTGIESRTSVGYWVGLVLLLLAAAFLAGVLHHPRPHYSHVSSAIWQLPVDAAWSLMRMLGAYVISLIFSLVVGIYAAGRPKSARFIIPILDILQSIPIVTFFPAALAVAISLLGGGAFGLNMAAIFLVFTGMAWNMAFSVYENIQSIPREIRECAEALGIRGTQRLLTIYIPSCVPGLLYNSIVSWTAGWFALTACEILTVGNKNISLPGLGSFIANANNSNNPIAMGIAGVGALLAVVVGIEIFIWRPLGVWAQRFRYEMTVSTLSRDSALLRWYQQGRFPRMLSRVLVVSMNKLSNAIFAHVRGTSIRSILPRREMPGYAAKAVTVGMRLAGWTVAALVCAGGLYYGWHTIEGHYSPLTKYIPLAIGLSFVRIAVAYLLSLLWTVPLVLWAHRRPRLLRGLSSVSQVLASLPAISLTFLVINIFVIHLHLGHTWGVEIAGEILLMNGVQWYVLFNMLAGLSRLPGDLIEVCDAMGLSRWKKFRFLLAPAIMPALLTGTVTAFGGGWNTLIFSEAIQYANKQYNVLGIGWLLDVASGSASPGHYAASLTGPQQSALLLMGAGGLMIFIVVFNRLVWRRLQAWASDRFRIEY
jgi:NitT/TauT family transport system permease protein